MCHVKFVRECHQNVSIDFNCANRKLYRPAHEHAGYDVHKCTKEAAILPLVQEETESVDLGSRDDKHDDSNKDGEVAVGLAGPIDNKLTIFLTPLSSCEKQTMTLHKVQSKVGSKVG